MKLRWKIGIGVTVLVALFAFASSFLFFCVIEDNMAPSPGLSPPGNVDKLLNEMEFGAIAFNAPTSINIDIMRPKKWTEEVRYAQSKGR